MWTYPTANQAALICRSVAISSRPASIINQLCLATKRARPTTGASVLVANNQPRFPATMFPECISRGSLMTGNPPLSLAAFSKPLVVAVDRCRWFVCACGQSPAERMSSVGVGTRTEFGTAHARRPPASSFTNGRAGAAGAGGETRRAGRRAGRWPRHARLTYQHISHVLGQEESQFTKQVEFYI